MDLKDNSAEVLSSRGYNVESGDFGTPYRVAKRDSLEPVIPNAQLPTAFEHDIVVIDLIASDPLKGPQGEKVVSAGESDWWESSSRGIIDPRPRAMVSVVTQLDRILQHGGVFVVFTSPRLTCGFWLGRLVDRGYQRGVEGKDVPFDNWSFLSVLSKRYLTVKEDNGSEIFAGSGARVLTELVMRHAESAHFNCVMSRAYRTGRDEWFELAKNKYGQCISVAIRIDNGEDRKYGFVLLLPQIRHKSALLSELFEDTVPRLSPHLFPYAEEAKWITRPDYELPEIVELKSQIELIESTAAREAKAVEAKISQVRAEKEYL
jgi:hypothetical protein